MAETATNKKSNITSWVTFVALMTGLAVIAALYWNEHITIQDVEISGIYFTDEAEIMEIAQPAIGMNPDSINLADLCDKIEKLNYVKTAIPFIEPNGTFRLQIIEREPIALLINDSERAYVDADGIILELLAGKIRNVPLLYGFEISISDTLNQPSFLQIRDFLTAAKINDFGWATISEVAYLNEEGVVALSHQNGVKLVFGNDDFKLKLDNWEAFYAQVVRTKGIEAFQKVDLRFTNQVVTNEI